MSVNFNGQAARLGRRFRARVLAVGAIATLCSVGGAAWGIAPAADAESPPGYELAVRASVSRASAAPGDRVPVGQKAKLGDLEILVNATDLNGTQKVLSENPYNQAPSPGRQFVISDISITNVGAKEAPLLHLSFSIVGESQKVFKSFEEGSNCGVLPGKLDTFGDVNPGETARGNVCVSLPVEEINGSTWKVTNLLDFRSNEAALLSVN
jgi:hypothetical protein